MAVGAAATSYSKELHIRLAEHTRSEVAVGAVISNSDDKHTRQAAKTRLEVAVGEATW